MPVTATPYGLALLHLGSGDFNFGSHTFKVALTTNAYAPDLDGDEYLSDVTNEITGTGYVAGGATLSGLVWAYDAAGNAAKLTADATTWTAATFTARRAVLYRSTGVDTTSPLLCVVDFGANESPAGIDWTITWSVDGIFRVAL